MALRCALMGLPGCGKTTVFNAITSAGASVFDGAETHRATVNVPDPRIERLVTIYEPPKIVPATLDVLDLPGLAEGSTAEGGRGFRLLGHAKEADALVHVIRCFPSPTEQSPDPAHDIEMLDLELMVADAQTIEKKIERLAKRVRAGDKDAVRESEDCQKVVQSLHDGIPARRQGLSESELASVFECNLVSLKPVLYVANVDDADKLNGDLLAAIQAIASQEGTEALAICGRDEADISELPEEDRSDFLAELGLEEPSANRLIHAAYRLLGLVDFFTAGEREVHVWTCRSGSTAPVAAGKIHTDMEKGFIRMEVIAYDDLIEHGSEQAVAKAGRQRLEGKTYEVQDGDIVVVRFSPPR